MYQDGDFNSEGKGKAIYAFWVILVLLPLNVSVHGSERRALLAVFVSTYSVSRIALASVLCLFRFANAPGWG